MAALVAAKKGARRQRPFRARAAAAVSTALLRH
jgi:hypothetical protein